MFAAIKVNMSCSEKKKEKANRSTYDISSIKRVTRKFHVAVVQNIAIEKGEGHVQSCLFFFSC